MATIRGAALLHLRLLVAERDPAQDALYVRLAAQYGVTVPEIVEASGLPVERVREILVGTW